MKSNPSTARQAGLRNVLIAVLVIVVVGVGTFYGVSYISSVQPAGGSSSSATTSSGLPSTTASSVSSGQTVSITSVSTQSSQPTVVGNDFTLIAGPSLLYTSGNSANVSVTYLNTGTTNMTVNVYVNVYFPNGTVEVSGALLYPGPDVAPGKSVPATLQTGPLSPPGTYIATFYVVEGAAGTSNQQISVQTTRSFAIPGPG
jgi:hypothetical protein